MPQIILETFGIVGLIAFGSLSGSLITIIIKHFLDKNKLKTERQAQLQKEIYFKLQDKAEDVFEGLYILKRRADEMFITQKAFIDKKIENLSKFEDDFKKERIKLASNLQLFFPNVNKKKYNDSITKHSKIGELHFKLYKSKTLTKEKINEFDKLYDEFNGNIFDLTKEILQELKKEKEKII